MNYINVLRFKFNNKVLINFQSIFNKININKVMPYLSVVIAVLLILRGLNLGVPYISPKIESSMTTADCSKACCYKNK